MVSSPDCTDTALWQISQILTATLHLDNFCRDQEKCHLCACNAWLNKHQFEADWNTDQVYPATSPKVHCNGLLLMYRKVPRKQFVWHLQKGWTIQKKQFHAVNNVTAGEHYQKLMHQQANHWGSWVYRPSCPDPLASLTKLIFMHSLEASENEYTGNFKFASIPKVSCNFIL